MVETILKIEIGELNTVRVTCQNCAAITEIKLENLVHVFGHPKCKHCDKQFFPTGMVETPFVELQHAVERFIEAKDKVRIEFVITAGPS